mmetsp:Transcript_4349/g.9652  ORF Transcript_4349/g.9652 Transcript_4349/m.9652 type:complete len:247 (-) Transcript_4349:1859-2599(-)
MVDRIMYVLPNAPSPSRDASLLLSGWNTKLDSVASMPDGCSCAAICATCCICTSSCACLLLVAIVAEMSCPTNTTPMQVPLESCLAVVPMSSSTCLPPAPPIPGALSSEISSALVASPWRARRRAATTTGRTDGATTADTGRPNTSSLERPVREATMAFHWTTAPVGSIPKMGALTESISRCSSACAASFSPCVCIRSSLSRASTWLRTSSASHSLRMSLTSSPSPVAASTSHLSHGAHLRRTDSV